jgi:hypothetical protein
MLTLNVITQADEPRIAGSIDGEVFNAAYEVGVFEELKKYQDEYESLEDYDAYEAWVAKVKDYLEQLEKVDPIAELSDYLKMDTKTGRIYLKAKGKVGKTSIPKLLADKILESADKGISPDPIAKAWTRFVNRNPYFSHDKAERFAKYVTATIVDYEEVAKLTFEGGFTPEKAIAKATYNDVAITQEGLIVTKRYARLLTKGWKIDPETNEAVKVDLYPVTKTVDQFSGEVQTEIQFPDYAEELTFEPPVMGRSGDAFYCGETKDHLIRVGQVHKLENWDQINTDDYNCCVKGLHVGGMKYVQGYKSLNAQLLECFVDPAEIGAIVNIDDQGSDGAIRVKEYFVYGAGELRNKGLYHSSKYAALKDAEWEEEVQKAIEKTDEMLENLKDLS